MNTPLYEGDPRAQRFPIHMEEVALMSTPIWVIVYLHRFGEDIRVVKSDDEPSDEFIINQLLKDEWEKGENFYVVGPFFYEQIRGV